MEDLIIEVVKPTKVLATVVRGLVARKERVIKVEAKPEFKPVVIRRRGNDEVRICIN